MAEALRRLSRPTDLDTLLEPGTVSVLMVAHDDWCAHFKGRDCTCEPAVEARRVSQATLDHPAEPGQG